MTIRFLISVVIALALAGPDAAGQIPCSYEIAAIIQGPDCGILGQASAVGTGISPNGEYVCGYFTCPGGNDVAFLYTVKTGAVTTIPFSQGFYSMIANDVNDNAIVVGTGQKTTAGFRGFVHDASSGITTELLPQNLPNGWSGANAINNAGTVCGWRTLDDGGSPTTPFNAFIWMADNEIFDLGVMTGPNSVAMDITQDGTVVGWTGVDFAWPGSHAFAWTPLGLFLFDVLSGGLSSGAEAANTASEVVGSGRIPDPNHPFFGAMRGFATLNKSLITIPPLPGFVHSTALDVSDTGVVLGVSWLLEGNPNVRRPFLWHSGTMVDMNERLPKGTAFLLTDARATSSAGVLTSIANIDGSIATVLLEPASAMTGDVDFTCAVNVDDLLMVINEWGKTKSPADANMDGMVNYEDLIIVIESWTVF